MAVLVIGTNAKHRSIVDPSYFLPSCCGEFVIGLQLS